MSTATKTNVIKEDIKKADDDTQIKIFLFDQR